MMKTPIIFILLTAFSTPVIAADQQTNGATQSVVNISEQVGSGNTSVITSDQRQLLLNADSTHYPSDYSQRQTLSQHAVNVSRQNGTNNVSLITSRQTQRSINIAPSRGASRNSQAQNNSASQHAINVSRQIGSFNLSVIKNRQTSIQGNSMANLPRFTGSARAATIYSGSHSSSSSSAN